MLHTSRNSHNSVLYHSIFLKTKPFDPAVLKAGFKKISQLFVFSYAITFDPTENANISCHFWYNEFF